MYMNKKLYSILTLWCLLASPIFFTACSEDDGTVDEYADWQIKNERYMDSIAEVAKTEPGWLTLRNYKLPPTELGQPSDDKVSDYVYAKVHTTGDGPVALFTDSVSVGYELSLINGKVMQKTWTTDKYEKEYDFPYQTRVNASGLREGWKIVLQYMPVGSYWTVYIPYQLGYGEAGNNDIPGYSDLIFDMHLYDVFPLKGIEGKSADREDDVTVE